MKTKAELNQLANSLKPIIESAMQKTSDEVLTVETAAKMLDTTPNAIRLRCNRGQMPYKKRGKRLYFSKNELTEFYLSN